MNFNTHSFHLWWRIFSFVLLLHRSVALNSDGVLMLSFKYSILSDPLSVLESWNYEDESPCSWNGVYCSAIGNPGMPDMFRVTSLVLPNNQLLGSIPTDLGMIQHLRHLDLSNNFFNGSLPTSIFNSSELQFLSLSNNVISGELPESIGELTSLQFLNLSDNALAGKIPENLTALKNLTVVSLRSNYFSGSIPGGFSFVEVLDLSSNLINGSLPMDFGGDSLRYFNLSYNKISGTIPPAFAKEIPSNATIDVSFNNLTGPIPQSPAFLNQKTELLAGNSDLCGKPLKILCSIPSTLSTPPNVSITSSPAIAAIPKPTESNPVSDTSGSSNGTRSESSSGLKPATIAGIAVGDLAGIAILAMVILYVYQLRKKKQSLKPINDAEKKPETVTKQDPNARAPTNPWSCLTIKGEDTSEAASSDSDHENVRIEMTSGDHQKEGTLVTLDGEAELELESLLKASAYILGSSGASIVYKAVLEDGTTFAVRRIGECGIERKKDFENQVKAIARLRHPNLVKIRGFSWGEDEKLVIYDYVPNGSLSSTSYRRTGFSPCHLPLEVRLKIAKGVAKGLAYIHEKKHVHGNIKPSNILLSSGMEAIISDFGLDRLLLGNKAGGSARHSVNQGSEPGVTPAASSSVSPWPYQSPELLQNVKPNPKWDVYSFGIVLLELLTGRIFSDRELGEWTVAGSAVEEKNRVFRMVDAVIRDDMEGREDAMLACFKLGFNCASIAPQKRPSMKEALQILDKFSP
ncbi:Receptor protein kinase-like protein [Quillaja saponaria]|uniref:Receptor protein kinase-like protein n=1 Tax=Quillaja saponaria TaxID=32244 RepID=A0AAD7M1T7_QUISA|nr:Receptor protein kinase-like protein [Quillaja saponaria]